MSSQASIPHFDFKDGVLHLDAPEFLFQGAAPWVSYRGKENHPEKMQVPPGTACSYSTKTNGFAGTGHEYTIDWNNGIIALSWKISISEESPVATLGAAIRNMTVENLVIDEIGLIAPVAEESIVCHGSPSEWALSSIGAVNRSARLDETLPSENEQTIAIWRGFNMPVPHELPDDVYHNDSAWRCFKDFACLYNNQDHGFSIAAVGDAQAFVDLRCRVESAGRIKLLASAEMNGIILSPGETRETQEIAIIALPYPEAQELIMRRLASTYGARVAHPAPSGWCSWYSRGENIRSEEVLAVAREAGEQRSHLKLDFIQIDDGFQKTVGDWECNEKFAEGWTPILEAIHSAEAKAGIWLAPLAVHEKTEIFTKHPKWFQRDANGNLAGEANNWGSKSRWLDPTVPEAMSFIRDLIRKFKTAGFEYFKIDFNILSENASYHDRSLTRLQIMRKLYAAYREEIGEDCYLLACSGFTRGVLGYSDAFRSGPDSSAKWQAEHSCCISTCIKTVSTSIYANKVIGAVDPDVTYLKASGSLTEDEWRTWHSFVGMTGGLTMSSELLHEVRSKHRMMAILTPPSKNSALPVQGGYDLSYTVFKRLDRRPWGDSTCIFVYNPDSETRTAEISLKQLDLRKDQHLAIWSFWDETIRFSNGEEILDIAKVPPHGCAVLRITPLNDSGKPTLIGSNLHISCGTEEVEDILYENESMTIILSGSGASDGDLFFAASPSLKLKIPEEAGLSLHNPSPALWKLSLNGLNRKGQRITLKF